MNESELLTILRYHLDEYKSSSYADLSAKVDACQPDIFTSGTLGEDDFYLVELVFVFDNCKSGDIRVLGMANNGSGIEVNDDFIMSPSGKIT